MDEVNRNRLTKIYSNERDWNLRISRAYIFKKVPVCFTSHKSLNDNH